jgi:uncharacterized protein YuzE
MNTIEGNIVYYEGQKYRLLETSDTHIIFGNDIKRLTVSLDEFTDDTAIEEVSITIEEHISDQDSNPHDVTKADVGLSDVPNLDTSDAVASPAYYEEPVPGNTTFQYDAEGNITGVTIVNEYGTKEVVFSTDAEGDINQIDIDNYGKSNKRVAFSKDANGDISSVNTTDR